MAEDGTESSHVTSIAPEDPPGVDITPDKDGGILKTIIKEGTADESPYIGNQVFVHYVGTLESDGSKFDSSRDREEPFDFQLGQGQVIKAWDIGLATMKKGEICQLRCRADYAYGKVGSPPKIPPNATLLFEIELLWWQGEDLTDPDRKDRGIVRSIVTPGDNGASPNQYAFVKTKIVGEHEGRIFDERTVEFNLAEGGALDIPVGIDTALKKFKKNETSILELAPLYGFGEAGCDKFKIPPDAHLKYTVTLLDFEKAKEDWEMSQEEKIDQAKIIKDKGTEYFKAGNYHLACLQYERVASLMSYDSGLSEEKKKENNALKLAGELNLAAAKLKLRRFAQAKEHASNALEQDPDNLKALYRRGQAFMELGELEEAAADLEKCVRLDPSNAAAKKLLVCVHKKIKEHKIKEKQIYAGMFDKFVKSDANRAAEARKAGVLKDGVGEWQDKVETGKNDEDLSEVKLISSDDQIKGDEFMNST
ncbi:hypothetical protein HAZT_HAZT000922 [Hyalella azteca]|uniref:peptidylprolyl isomerase n=1 Tax=Hyalella azteca TaxID=294128 RepID=A0A6A0GZ38_HYAAZ|nr:peptidyl-prolyl cis-trans isomerase FKBP4 [Hyalella azteca]KAA0193554.1 hypothetical protein HAZT_HAZT000922 [Hyalella azteca]